MRLDHYLMMAVLVFALPSVNADSGQSEFAQGSAAYKAGDYTTALTYFNKALAAGNEQPTLIYNRAVTLYKLEQLKQAQQAFAALLSDAQWHDIALFNLARIDERLGQQTSALERYRFLVNNTQNARLRELSQTKKNALQAAVSEAVATTEKTGGKRASKGAVLLKFGATYDDNASGLANDIVNKTEQADDLYFGNALYGHYYLSGKKDHGTKVYGLSQVRRFSEFRRFDTDVAGLGFATERTNGYWQWALGSRFLNLQTNMGKLANQYTASATATRKFSSNSISLLYQLNYFDAGQNFEFLEGMQTQVKLHGKYSAGSVTFTPAFQYEINDREDRNFEQRHYSYSPTIVGIDLGGQWQVNQNWRAYASGSWQHAEYSGTNRLIDLGGEEKAQQREYERTQTIVGIQYQMTPHWSVKAQWQNTESNDRFEVYSYEKQAASISIEYAKQ